MTFVPPKADLFERLPLLPEADMDITMDTDDKADLQAFQQDKEVGCRKPAICRQADAPRHIERSI